MIDLIKEKKRFIVIGALGLVILTLFLPFYKLLILSTNFYSLNKTAFNAITIGLLIVSMVLTYFEKEKLSLLTIIPALAMIVYRMIDVTKYGSLGIGAFLSVILLLIAIFLQIYNFNKK